MPAALAKLFSGWTPTERMITSEANFCPFSKTITLLFSSKQVADWEVMTFTPLSTNSAWTKAAISSSSGDKTCGAFSTIVTFKPRLRRFSAVSRPINPAPMTTAS